MRRWVPVMVLSFPLVIALPLCAQQQSQSPQKSTSSTQDLPSAPQPQPTAGQKKPDTSKPTAAPPPPPPPSEPGPYGPTGPSSTSQAPRSAPPPSEPGSSSSKDDKIDVTPPANDAKAHPNADMDTGDADVGEFHPFDPHRAAKDVEVGDFYFKRRNYRAAISRYRDALLYKPNDAIATFSLADALEKAGDLREALQNYQAYLKILPYGPKAKEAHTAITRLKSKVPAKPAASANASPPQKQ